MTTITVTVSNRERDTFIRHARGFRVGPGYLSGPYEAFDKVVWRLLEADQTPAMKSLIRKIEERL